LEEALPDTVTKVKIKNKFDLKLDQMKAVKKHLKSDLKKAVGLMVGGANQADLIVRQFNVMK